MKSHLQSYPCPLQINSFWFSLCGPSFVFILYVFELFFSFINLYCLKGLHFS
jgi:hypothetical protein